MTNRKTGLNICVHSWIQIPTGIKMNGTHMDYSECKLCGLQTGDYPHSDYRSMVQAQVDAESVDHTFELELVEEFYEFE